MDEVIDLLEQAKALVEENDGLDSTGKSDLIRKIEDAITAADECDGTGDGEDAESDV